MGRGEGGRWAKAWTLICLSAGLGASVGLPRLWTLGGWWFVVPGAILSVLGAVCFVALFYRLDNLDRPDVDMRILLSAVYQARRNRS